MRFKLTILNVTALLFITGCIIYFIINYTTLSKGEGWGVVFMLGLILYGLSALWVDWTVRMIFRKSNNLHWISAIFAIIYIVVFFAGL